MAVLHSQSIEAPRQTLHRVADSCERPHAARPALDVLTQPTERDKLGAAFGVRAPIDLVLVARALQVLIEALERLERRVAQETCINDPVPRAPGRPRHRAGGRLKAARWAREQAGGVRDVVVRVGTDDEAVELLACHAGPASTRL